MTSTLFETLPPTLFNPLAAQGAPVYGEVLLRLFAATQQSYQPLSREAILYVVGDLLTDPAALALTAEADDATAEHAAEADDLVPARAAAIVRYLVRCGWLRSEMQSNFSQTYILPDYAFRLLAVLSEIAHSEPPSLRGLIYSIYALLTTSLNEGTVHIGLPEAHRQTTQLLNGLKELQHNIGTHIERVLQHADTAGVLEQLFLNYRAEIVDRAYHQLRTTDHVSRFRPGVLQALAQIQADGQLDEVAQRLFYTRDAPTVEAAVLRTLEQLRTIREQFDSLDQFLQAIDARHSQFVDAAVRNIELRLSASSSTSGQLHTLVSQLLTERDEQLADDAAQLVSLFRLELLDSDSPAPPLRPAEPFVPTPAVIPVLSHAEIEAAQTATLRQLNRAISRERVRRFALDLLDGCDELRGSRIPLDNPEELPLLMYLRAYGNGTLGYRVDELDDGEWIVHGNVGFRDFILRRMP